MSLTWINDGGGSPLKIEDVYSGFDKYFVEEIIGRHVEQECPTADLACGMNVHEQESTLAINNPDHYISDNMSEHDLLTRLGLYANAFVSYVTD